MRLALVFGVVGRLLRLNALFFLPPMLLAWADGDAADAQRFLAGSLCALALGSWMVHFLPKSNNFRRAEALAVVALAWLFMVLMSSVPYILSGLTPIDAIFESMSGLTATGATILTDWDQTRAFFLWRALTQWIGGVGVIALFVVVLPHLGVGGRQLFAAEASSVTASSVAPKIRDTATRIWSLFAFLTLLCAGLLHFAAGMPLFDSICHALTTAAAGGFSPNPLSIAGYANPAMYPGWNPVIGEWILTGFMVLAGMSFPLLWLTLSKNPGALLRDGEFRLFFLLLLAASGLLFLLGASGMEGEDGFRTAAFQTASLMTSTGLATTDFALWAPGALTILIFVMLVGGCAGSAAGGAKAGRMLLAGKFLYREMTRVIHPRAVIPIRMGHQAVSERAMRAVLTVVLLYVGGYFVLGSILVLCGLPWLEGFTAALSSLGNIGPALGSVGPMASFAELENIPKSLLILAMWAGRLEILTILALLHPDILRRLCWRDGSK